MKFLQTKKKEESKFPSRLDVLQELAKRQTLDKKLEDELYRLEKRYLGEQAVLEYLEEYGAKHWHVMTNVWLDYYGSFKCDLILLTNTSIHNFEVKNYSGNYEYKESQWSRDGKRMGHNVISQAHKATNHLQNILEKSSYNEKVKGGIIFAGSIVM